MFNKEKCIFIICTFFLSSTLEAATLDFFNIDNQACDEKLKFNGYYEPFNGSNNSKIYVFPRVSIRNAQLASVANKKYIEADIAISPTEVNNLTVRNSIIDASVGGLTGNEKSMLIAAQNNLCNRDTANIISMPDFMEANCNLPLHNQKNYSSHGDGNKIARYVYEQACGVEVSSDKNTYQVIMKYLNNFDCTKPFVRSNAHPAVEAQREVNYGMNCGRASGSENSLETLNTKYQHFELVQVFPRSVTIDIIYRGNRQRLFDSSTAGTLAGDRIYADIDVTNNAQLQNAFHRNRYQYIISYQYPSFSYQSALGSFTFSDISRITGEAVTKQIRKVIKKSTGALFWEDTTTTVKDTLESQMTSKQDNESSTQIKVVTVDYDGSDIENFVNKHLFEQVSLGDLIRSHEIAAKSTSGGLRIAHMDYAKELSTNGLSASVDSTKAIAALSKGDMLSFLSSGLSMKNSRSSGTYSARRIINFSNSTKASEEFSRIALKSTNLKHSVIVQPEINK